MRVVVCMCWLLCFITINSLDLKISHLEEIEYAEIHEDLFKLNDYRFLDENTISSFDESLCKILVLDLENLSAKYIGQKGKGPGDLQQASFFVKKGDEYICVDYVKDAVIKFDQNFDFLSEDKLDFSAISFGNFENEKFGIMKNTLFMDSENKEELFQLYDASLGKKEMRFKYDTSQWEHGKFESYLLYSTSSIFTHKNFNYLFFQSLPLILKTNYKTGEFKFINFENELNFTPVQPTLKKVKIGNGRGIQFIANFFVYEVAKKEDSIYLSLINPVEEMSDITTSYIYKYSYSDDSFEKVNLIGENVALQEDLRIILTNTKLLIFNNDKEIVSIYKVDKK